MSNTRKLIDAIMDSNGNQAGEVFSAAISDKVNTVLDIKRVAITADIYNKVEESTGIKKEILNPDVTKDLPEDSQSDLKKKQTSKMKHTISQLEKKGFVFQGMVYADDDDEDPCAHMVKKNGAKTVIGQVDVDGNVNSRNIDKFLSSL